MTYKVVTTKQAGDGLSAKEYNQFIKDNMAAGIPDIFTTKGDIAAATAANVASRLGVGANGTLLTAASGEATGLSWTTPNTAQAYARYKVSAERTMTNATATIINFDTSVFDSDSAVTTGAAWKFTVPADHDGYYLVLATALIKASVNWGETEKFELQLFLNGVLSCVLGGTSCQVAAGAGYQLFVTGGTIISLIATDYIDIRGYQNSGANHEINSDGNYSHVSIAKLF